MAATVATLSLDYMESVEREKEVVVRAKVGPRASAKNTGFGYVSMLLCLDMCMYM